jgi:cephalosporin hydroxylase
MSRLLLRSQATLRGKSRNNRRDMSDDSQSAESPDSLFGREVNQNLVALASAREFQELSRSWLRDSLPYRYSYNFTSVGRPIIQYPQDMVAINELIWSVRPDVIVETGVAHGGSLLQSAAALALLDYCDAVTAHGVLSPTQSRRRVIGVDIDIRSNNRRAIESHPLSHKIELLTGSSIDPEIVTSVTQRLERHEKVMVLLDSNHTHAHVYAELESYAPLVTIGSYCIVFDSIIEFLPTDQFPDRPWGPGNSPFSAAKEYLLKTAKENVIAMDGSRLQFQIDSNIDAKLMISVAPKGYLRRIALRPVVK